MKKSDIKIGQHYAYASYEHGSRAKVEVLELDVESPRRSYGRSQPRGTKVRFVNSEDRIERVVPNREIREEWEPYAARVAAETAQRRERAHQSRIARRERAPRVLAIIAALEAAGVKSKPVRLWNANAVGALVEAAGLGFHVLEVEEVYGSSLHVLVPDESFYLAWFGSGQPVALPLDDLAKIVGL